MVISILSSFIISACAFGQQTSDGDDQELLFTEVDISIEMGDSVPASLPEASLPTERPVDLKGVLPTFYRRASTFYLRKRKTTSTQAKHQLPEKKPESGLGSIFQSVVGYDSRQLSINNC
ncbi:hypothetical protein F5883DRAFT_113652 [Diaporthe sp. PMI_573]|nr:hypothetical protein F5883DRAFT_113652 [Diaporthaceae sp. PMI_573]